MRAATTPSSRFRPSYPLLKIVEECSASPTPNPVIVNLDDATVTLPSDVVLPLLPERFKESFVRQYNLIPLNYEVYTADSASFDPENDVHARAAHAER